MTKATKIRMKSGKEKSNQVSEIDSIYLEGFSSTSSDGWYKKEEVHNLLIADPTLEIKVDISPFPKLIPVTRGTEKYVKTVANESTEDNLLQLPKV